MAAILRVTLWKALVPEGEAKRHADYSNAAEPQCRLSLRERENVVLCRKPHLAGIFGEGEAPAEPLFPGSAGASPSPPTLQKPTFSTEQE